jgi:hypothetical protein
MSAWGKSDNKSSDGTVALSAPSITFNAATGHAAGVYTSAGHPFQLGDPVVYSNGSGTSVVGLTSGSTYYVTNVTANTFMVASTEDRALRNVPEAIVSTDGIGSSHTFTLPLALGRGTLTGTNSTIFTEELSVGDIVRASSTGGNQEMIVIAVTSDTLATVINANPGTTLTAFADDEGYRIHEKPTFVSSVATTDFESTQVFGVRSDEIHGDQTGGYISAVSLIQGGTRYLETPAVGFSGGGGADAEATATISGGVVTAITVTNNGSSYETAPTVNLSVPRRTVPISDVAIATEQFTYATHGLSSAEEIKYYHNGGTAVTGLVNGTSYFVSALGFTANTFRLAASASAAAGRTALAGVAISGTGGQFTCTATTLAAGDRIRITGTLGGTGSISGYATGNIYTVSAVTGTSPNVTAFTLTDESGGALTTTAGTPTGLTYTPFTIVLISGTGNDNQYFDLMTATTATARAALGVNQGVDNAESGAVAHTGWVHRKVLTGAHAGRIQYEVLVALSKNGITSDAADDIAFPED